MRDFDFVMFEHDALVGLGSLMQDIYSGMGTSSVVADFTVTPTTPASLNINIAPGRIYSLAFPDPNSVGSIPQDVSAMSCMQGQNLGQTLSFTPPATGLSQWNLVQVQFSPVDTVRPGDPNGGTVPFYNSTNTTVPNESSIATVRQHRAVLQIIQGTASATGSEVPPQPSSGWTPLYLVDLAGGQSSITASQVIPAGPSVGTNVPANYPFAPFLAGFQASHHSGKPGSAPKINLTTEVVGVLPSANLPPNILTGSFPPVRQQATAAITIFVNPTSGLDTNNGLTSTAPVKTINRAWAILQDVYDHVGFIPTIQLLNGTHNAALINGWLLGAPSFNLLGNNSSPSSVTITGANTSALLFTNTAGLIGGFTITATGAPTSSNVAGHGILAATGADVSLSGPIVFGACGGYQLAAGGGEISTAGQAIAFTGSAQAALGVSSAGLVVINNSTITLSNTPAYSAAFALAFNGGAIQATGNTFIGTATGVKFSAALSGNIAVSGGGPNYFPGSIAGTINNGTGSTSAGSYG